MCGIVAVIGSRDAAPLLLEGLRQLEYRGYDSACIATLQSRDLHCIRAKGKLNNLSSRVEEEAPPVFAGLVIPAGRPMESLRSTTPTPTVTEAAGSL